MLVIPIVNCKHFGVLLWADHATVYCANCGFAGRDPDLITNPSAHSKGELVQGFHDPSQISPEPEH